MAFEFNNHNFKQELSFNFGFAQFIEWINERYGSNASELAVPL